MEDDFRVVYDGTSSGLNAILLAPNFFLPTSHAAALQLSYLSWLADVDFGEMFNNFFAPPAVRKFSGVDISAVAPFLHASNVPAPRANGQISLRWNRLFIGMRSSPYNDVCYYYLCEEFAWDDPSDPHNPFHYDQIVLNLPGTDHYDPSRPKLMKWNSSANRGSGAIAGDVTTFVDDVRVVDHSKENCHAVHRQFASRIQFLGLQDAPRKFRPPSQAEAGAWAGTIFRINSDSVSKSIAQSKWKKAQAILVSLRETCDHHPQGSPDLNRKDLEWSTGFLNYVAMTYENNTPFLKGFYLSLNSWRPKGNAQGWRVSDKDWLKIVIAQVEDWR